jgi:hypothetical protein
MKIIIEITTNHDGIMTDYKVTQHAGERGRPKLTTQQEPAPIVKVIKDAILNASVTVSPAPVVEDTPEAKQMRVNNLKQVLQQIEETKKRKQLIQPTPYAIESVEPDEPIVRKKKKAKTVLMHNKHVKDYKHVNIDEI